MGLVLLKDRGVILAATVLVIVVWAAWLQLRSSREDPKFALWMLLLRDLPRNDAGEKETSSPDHLRSSCPVADHTSDTRDEHMSQVARMRG